jgi:hypothetical protein
MTKKYTFKGAIYRSRAIRVSTPKGVALVEFNGGALNASRQNCFFSTSDKELQTAIEQHPLFNAADGDGFVLSWSSGEDDAVAAAGASGNGSPSLKVVGDVKTFADARKYVLENYREYAQSDVATAAKLNKLADKLGISFPEWAESLD